MIRLPKIDLRYWILMVLATTIGEIVGNLISRNLGLGYSTGSIFLILSYLLSLVIVAIRNIQSKLIYWYLIILGNIAGTNCADFITIEPLKLGTIFGSLLVMGILTLTLIVWKLTSKNLSIDSGLSKTTFYLYWLAIITSSTFGTTSGDFLSNDTSLGAGGGTILLAGLLFIIVVLTNYTKVSKEICYWLALVIIHPIGATTGNYISKPAGLNFGNIWTSVALVLMFILIFISDKINKKQNL